MGNDKVLDLERAKNIIGSAQGIVFYLDFTQMTAADGEVDEDLRFSLDEIRFA